MMKYFLYLNLIFYHQKIFLLNYHFNLLLVKKNYKMQESLFFKKYLLLFELTELFLLVFLLHITKFCKSLGVINKFKLPFFYYQVNIEKF